MKICEKVSNKMKKKAEKKKKIKHKRKLSMFLYTSNID